MQSKTCICFALRSYAAREADNVADFHWSQFYASVPPLCMVHLFSPVDRLENNNNIQVRALSL